MESAPSSVALCGGGGYPDSVDSSPRSRGGDSWDDPYPLAATAASRLRLMCSYGGRIVPRPTDKSLCYLGGETRIVVVDRHASLADLHALLSCTLLGGHPFSLKYQLPNEDLDSLISVSTDEDLENMVEEYDRIVASKPEFGAGGGTTRTSSRIRLFLFPSKMDSFSSIGSLLDDSSKSETWFVDALNSAMGLGAIDGIPRGISVESTSVNCLLGLENDSSTHSRTSTAARGAVGAGNDNGDPKLARQDVQSVSDSPIIDKSSSFGSTSSAPSLSNLPPIRVRADDRLQDHRIPAVEDHFAHMILSSAADPLQIHPPAPTQLPTAIVASAPIPAFSPSDNPNRFSSDDDDKSDHGGSRKHQQPNPTSFDGPLPDSSNRQAYYQERSSYGEQKRDLPVSADASYRTQVPIPDAVYVYPPQPQPPQSQPQFIPANAHYIQHAPTGAFVPMPSYYPIQQPQQSHQLPMYFLPVHQNVLQNPSPYNLSAMSPPLADPTTGKPAIAVPQLPLSQELPPANLYRTTAAAPANAMHPPALPTTYTGMGYHLVHPLHHPSQSMAAVANYAYEFADPACAPMYYSQTTSPPSVAPQYQTKVSTTPQVTDVGLVDMMQTRAS